MSQSGYHKDHKLTVNLFLSTVALTRNCSYEKSEIMCDPLCRLSSLCEYACMCVLVHVHIHTSMYMCARVYVEARGQPQCCSWVAVHLVF